MNLEAAIQAVRSHVQRINELYQKTAFDEWALVAVLGLKGRVLHYEGPRKDDFQKNFAHDAQAFTADLRDPDRHIGDFDFNRHGSGTRFDAILVVGDGLFLLCNHTASSISAITHDPLWLSAQVAFVEMSDQFRSDPLLHPM
jgi:hypothetical protein